MSIAVLLSIKPEFALAIFSGEKQFEFRRIIYRDHSVSKVYVYASAPISKVIGAFYVEEIIERHPKMLWQETRHGAGVTEEYFHAYFADREIGYALKVKDADRFEESQDLEQMFGIRHPPQSFRYVPISV
uniref:Predicted transcriptional regulator, contains an HTH and PUA-like domains n=1 Tax=Candidatus Kentrum sp. UNK TaxID=2126344 RepID=A0A451AST4_9GAMM|nr:MAG: Predicted transcriptional regulator, contains an HTH and PUA-like domains [Candidatus Kentron sp. UNK]VFK69101.1 MAG: Predicted transcriptional regulator, contains an HTH and PUA-like domains [Candidatus Kentron sp. UNK]